MKLYQQIKLHAFLCMTLPRSSITEGPMLSGQQITSSRPIGRGEVTPVLKFSITPQKLTGGTGEALCILNLDTLNGGEWSASCPQFASMSRKRPHIGRVPESGLDIVENKRLSALARNLIVLPAVIPTYTRINKKSNACKRPWEGPKRRPRTLRGKRTRRNEAKSNINKTDDVQ